MGETLIGKFFIANDAGHEHFKTGEIIGQVTPTHYLAKFDAMHGDDVSFGCEIIDVSEMAATCKHCDAKLWSFFNTRESVHDFLNWLDKPAPVETKDKVVPIKGDPKR